MEIIRKNKYIYYFGCKSTCAIFWFLIETIFLFSLTEAKASFLTYDSSLIGSNFLSRKPLYQEDLEDQLQDRRSLFLWKLRFDSQSLETDQNNHSRNVGATIRTKFRYRIIENVYFKSMANLTLESGRSQSIFGDIEPGSGVYPREIKLQWQPFGKSITLDFGQIHQFWFGEPLFLANLGFPGLSERWTHQSENWGVSLIGQQLIPTSSTLGTRVAQREEIPYFFTESVQAHYKFDRDHLIKGRLTHYRYMDLPAIVAFDSFLYGNMVVAPDRNNSRFVYEFDGFMSQLLFEKKWNPRFSARVQWNMIKNFQAPDTNGEAQSLRALVVNDFGRWLILGQYINYFIESDAVPAFYNSFLLGHNNRIGQSYQLNFELKDWGVILKLHYTDADLLSQSIQRVDGLQQDNQQTFYFSVETLYDFI